MQKQVTLSIQAPFFTRGNQDPHTTDIWIVCHGFGQLARHFVKRFDILDSTHYVIAPQGLDRFYYENYTKVGASWTTREQKDLHISNQLTYLDAVFKAETRETDFSTTCLHLMGFSQGVSVITRWAASRRIPFDQMILWAGGLPPELAEKKWELSQPHARVQVVVGKEDPFLTPERMKEQSKLLHAAFDQPEVVYFDGGHEVQREVLRKII